MPAQFETSSVRFTDDDLSLLSRLAPAVARRLGVASVSRADLIRMGLRRLARDELPTHEDMPMPKKSGKKR